jgi:hypothetical protein
MIANVAFELFATAQNMRSETASVGIVAKTGEIIVCTNSRTMQDIPSSFLMRPHGHLVVPLEKKGPYRGVMDLYIPVDAVIGEAKLRQYSRSKQLGIAIQNARLYEATISFAP